MIGLLCKMWLQDDGQDIAEYAVMLAVILVLVGQNQRISVLVENGEDFDRLLIATEPGAHGQRDAPGVCAR